MFVEGYIDKEFLRIITEAGFDVLWVAKTHRSAKRRGYPETEDHDFEKDVIARIFIDGDMEEYLMPILINDMEPTFSTDPGLIARSEGVRKKLLGLMAVCGNERMKEYATEELENADRKG